MIEIIKNLIFTPSSRYPENWKPAYLAMQLGFIAGGFGLLGRDLIIITTVENWNIIILSELFFAIFIGLGFLLHTLGFAQLGIILSCIAGIGSASSFNFDLTKILMSNNSLTSGIERRKRPSTIMYLLERTVFESTTVVVAWS